MKIYKGYELMKMLSKGEVNLKQKVNTLSLDYKNCTIDFVIKDRAENIMDLDFELIEDEIDIQEIEEIAKMSFNFHKNKYTGSELSDNFEKIVELLNRQSNKQNELIKAVKQLDKKLKEKIID